MKDHIKFRYIIAALLLLVGFAFNGELFIRYANDFQEGYYQADFSFSETGDAHTNHEILENVIRAGERNGVDYFFVDYLYQSAGQSNISVYGTKHALAHLAKKEIKDGDYGSLFQENIQLRCYPIRDLDHITSQTYCYFIGGEDKLKAMRSFKGDLVVKYGGGFPHLLGSNVSTYLSWAFVWGCLLCVLLFLTGYEVVIGRKERAVSFIMGEDLPKMARRQVAKDSAVYLVLATFSFLLMSHYVKASFLGSLDLCAICLLIVLNAALLLSGLRVDVRRDFSTARKGTLLLRFNYGMKILTTGLLLVLIVENVMVIQDWYECRQMEEYFRSHKQYSFCRQCYSIDNTLGKNEDDDLKMNIAFYQRFGEGSLRYCIESDRNGATPVLSVNKAALKEICENNPEIEKIAKAARRDSTFALYPSSMTSSERSEIRDWATPNQQPGMKEYAYKDPCTTIAIWAPGDGFSFRTVKNPLLLVDNRAAKQIGTPTPDGDAGYETCYEVMYTLSDEDYGEFIEDYDLRNQITEKANVWAVYRDVLSEKFRNMRFSIALLFLFSLMELMLITVLLKRDFQINSMEIVLSKLSGYSLPARNRRIYIVTLLGTLTGFVAACLVNALLQLHLFMWELAAAALAVGVMETLVITRNVHIIETANINQLLKGRSG